MPRSEPLLAVAVAGAALGALSTADPGWCGWIGSSAAPWIVAAWVLTRCGARPAGSVGRTGAVGTGSTVGLGVAAMMLAYEGAQAVLDPTSSFGYTPPWIVVTVALGIAGGLWRRWDATHPVVAVAAGAGAVAVPTALLAAVQVVHRAPPGGAVGVLVAIVCAAVVVVVDRTSIARHPRAAGAGAVSGTALFALGGLLVVLP